MEKMSIEKSIRMLLIFSLLKFAYCYATATGSEDEFRMINQFEEVEMHENYSRVDWYVASERSSVECGGVFKRLQSEVISPGYPDSYGNELHCEYTFKSPFVCSSQYHFQFVDFDLEPSRNCYKDRLVIGDEEVLCGTVIGSKKYNSTNGILKVKFVTDGWGAGKGFRIVVTRQPCDDNEALETTSSYTVYTTLQVAEETTEAIPSLEDELSPPKTGFKINSRQDIPPEFNPGGNGYLPPVTTASPLYPINTCPPTCVSYPKCYPIYPRPTFPNYPNYPMYPIGPNYPSFPTFPVNPNYPRVNYPNFPNYPGTVTPIIPNPNCPNYPEICPPNYPTNNGGGTNSIGGAPPGYQPTVSDPEIELTENITAGYPERQDIPPPPVLPGLPQCCRNTFGQRRFYLVSPNFPTFQTINQDCFYIIQRSAPNTCRLVISFKYFVFGDERISCTDAFLEIDGRRICGCRTGMVYTSQWGNTVKTIRVRSRANRYSNIQGFVLDIYQESCPYRYIRSQPAVQDRSYSYQVQPLTPLNITTVQTNSSSIYTYYYYNTDQVQQERKEPIARVPERQPEGPSSRFFYPNNFNSYGSCQFNSLDWLRLKVESLWVSKPPCY